ncbi:HEXXH motif domain-containing protein [Streptomyces griseoaurantiacus]|uniref:HEXXH motif domain-containing protein n=1 Tax=Streptomyces griseoaurantiacus TaxID=68213 RepID=UPI002E2BB6C4|nr:HEXXH motif domain-containing protein [Streptomyces jietaisiensis]
MTPFDTLRMTAADFAAVAGCRPTSQALTVLREGQISRRLLMLKSVADMARRTVPGLWSRSGAADGWELCGRARGADAQAFEWVVLAPHVGVWLGRCLRALTRSGPASRLSVDLSRLGSFAAAAALRAGLHPDITLSTPDGLLWLPTLGVAELPEGTRRVRLDGPYLRLAGRTVGLREDQGRRLATEGPRWLSPHRVTVHPDGRGPVLSVAIDDVDPYRLPAHGHPVQKRQDSFQVAHWEQTLGEAWRLLAAVLPERADACAGLCTTLVPLLPDPAGRGRSSSSRETYGAVAVAPQDDPERLAETLLHETAHVSFAALTDLVDLADPHDESRHRVGWRPDPRPVGAVLTGAHAHLALLEFWARRARETSDATARIAAARHERYGRQVAAALRQLHGHRALTPRGALFVDHMIAEAEHHGRRVRRFQAGHHPGGGLETSSSLRVTSGDAALPKGNEGRSPQGHAVGTGEASATTGGNASAIQTRRGAWTEQPTAGWQRENGLNAPYCA